MLTDWAIFSRQIVQPRVWLVVGRGWTPLFSRICHCACLKPWQPIQWQWYYVVNSLLPRRSGLHHTTISGYCRRDDWWISRHGSVEFENTLFDASIIVIVIFAVILPFLAMLSTLHSAAEEKECCRHFNCSNSNINTAAVAAFRWHGSIYDTNIASSMASSSSCSVCTVDEGWRSNSDCTRDRYTCKDNKVKRRKLCSAISILGWRY